jgi:hypothetical protein
MGNSNSTEGNNLVASYQHLQHLQQEQEQKRQSGGSDIINPIQKPTSSSSSSTATSSSSTSQKRQSFQSSITEPTANIESTQLHHWSPKEPSIQEDNIPTITTTSAEPIPMKETDNSKDNNTQPETTTKAVPVSTGKSGWVSSTGAASPWYGYLSTSNHHRASISGPYYRTRGMSVTRDSENDEDLTSILSSTANTSATASTITTNQQQQLQPPSSSVVQPNITTNQGKDSMI